MPYSLGVLLVHVLTLDVGVIHTLGSSLASSHTKTNHDDENTKQRQLTEPYQKGMVMMLLGLDIVASLASSSLSDLYLVSETTGRYYRTHTH